MLSDEAKWAIGRLDPDGTMHKLRTCLSDVGVDPRRVERLDDGGVVVVWAPGYEDQLDRKTALKMALQAWELVGVSTNAEALVSA